MLIHTQSAMQRTPVESSCELSRLQCRQQQSPRFLQKDFPSKRCFRWRVHATTLTTNDQISASTILKQGKGLRQTKDDQHCCITQQTIKALEAELDQGPSIAALRRFNDNLRRLPSSQWVGKLGPVMAELAFNLESFNPAFTAVLLKVQCCIGQSDYVRRDMALKDLIQPLAAKTHRELFSEFYEDLMKSKLEDALAQNAQPEHSVALFQQMIHDIQTGGGRKDAVEQASYAMGYNLAIEYLADYEKTWMLDSFRELNDVLLVPQGRPLSQWTFLEVHAEGEAEHAALGHRAVAGFVPSSHSHIVQEAMKDHDRDFSVFYNAMADMLQ